MRGQILHFDREKAVGQISGDDGNRYMLAQSEWRGQTPPRVGQHVDFQSIQNEAHSVYPMPSTFAINVASARDGLAAGVASVRDNLRTQSANTPRPKSEPRPLPQERTVSFGLVVGILLLPLIFVWFTLRRGHSTTSRVFAFSWLVAAFFCTIALRMIDLSSRTNESRFDPVYIASEEEGALGSSSPAVTDSGNQPDLTATETSAPSTEQPVPTFGQFNDKISIGIDKFSKIYRKKGMASAERYSVECSRAALRSSDILDLDFCVAFDMSAILADDAAVQSGAPRNQYFANRASEFDQEYRRFSQVAPGRTSLIWDEVRQRLPALISL